MKVLYYPGCSLRNSYPEFEKSAYAVSRKLGIELAEIPEWSCCGVVPSLATDNVMRHLGAVRSFINAQEKGRELATNTVMTLCSMCYNVLKRVNLILKTDAEALKTINSFIDDQPDYVPQLEIVHFLTLLSKMGFEKVRECVVRPLDGLRIAPYYGCALLRPDKPQGLPIDNPDNPQILETLISTTSAEPVAFPFKAECCGSYHVVSEREISAMRTEKIAGSAKLHKADLIVSSCPLCTFNLQQGHKNLDKSEQVPVIFFTQLLALALGTESSIPSPLESEILEKIGGTNPD